MRFARIFVRFWMSITALLVVASAPSRAQEPDESYYMTIFSAPRRKTAAAPNNIRPYLGARSSVRVRQLNASGEADDPTDHDPDTAFGQHRIADVPDSLTVLEFGA